MSASVGARTRELLAQELPDSTQEDVDQLALVVALHALRVALHAGSFDVNQVHSSLVTTGLCDHPYGTPFKSLPQEEREADRPYLEAAMRVALQIAKEYPRAGGGR